MGHLNNSSSRSRLGSFCLRIDRWMGSLRGTDEIVMTCRPHKDLYRDDDEGDKPPLS